MKSILLIVLLLMSGFAIAQDAYSMRRCVLLPISDGLNGALGTKVFAELETYLKETTWCQYQSNSDLLGIFSRYRENLHQHLKTPEVVRVVADKLKAGSIIRINLVKEISSLEVQLDVVGANGDDILFSERSVLNNDDLEVAAQTIRNWLEIFGKIIPYDGRITGILGDQITLDIGKGYTIKIGQEFTAKRLKGIKKHPLLKKVVEWDARVMATGKVFSISDNQALGVVKVYKSDVKLQVGDWVRLEKLKDDKTLDELRYPVDNKEAFGKLGIASFYLVASSSSLNASAGGSKRVGGYMLGFEGRAEAWVTRNWFGLFEIDRSLGTLKKTSGDLDSSKVDYQRGTFKIGGGYKYLPLGFFYGPQVDLYGGYSTSTYKADVSEADGFGEFGYSGFYLGVGTNFPVGREYRGVLRAEFMPFPEFNDEDSVYGSAKSSSWLQMELGVKYQYSPSITLDGMLEMSSTKATFKGDVRSVSATDTALKAGASINF
ncbi:MAG: hypothetical protein ACLGG0_03960 [Bacteriovoracia bacterium]